MQHENDLFARAFNRYTGYKRRAERSVQDVLSGGFILAGVAFWLTAFWQLIGPPSPLSIQAINVAVLAFVVSVAAPLLWSALVPRTPAAQLLQKANAGTLGFAAVVAAAAYLSYFEFQLLTAWLAGQPAIAESGLVWPVGIALEIAFILIPALGWTNVPFHVMLDQIQQAHEIRKLDMNQRAEMALLKNRVLWAQQKAAVEFANLLPHEQAYVFSTLEGLFKGMADSQRSIVRMLDLSADAEQDFAILPDQQIVTSIRHLADRLHDDIRAVAVQPIREVAPAAVPRDVTPVAPPRPVPPRSPESPQRPAAPRSAPQRYADDYAAARKGLREWPAWTVATLGQILDMKERTARDRVNAWIEEGLVEPCGKKGRYNFTESEAA